MAYGAFKLVQAENRLKEYAFSFFIKIGCISPEKALSLMQLRVLGFGVTDAGIKYLFKYGFVRTDDDKMYLDIQKARYRIIRYIIGTWIGLFLMSVILYFLENSFSYHLVLTPITVILMILVFIPLMVYYAKPLKFLKLEQ